MSLSAFEQTNLKSKKIKLFFYLLLVMAAGYTLGMTLYFTQQTGSQLMAMEMVQRSGICFIISVMLVLFLLTLRWQILRTLTLAFSLLGLVFLYCALVLLLFKSTAAHAVGLVVLGILFTVLFITQSNLFIYLRDRTYGDALLEGLIASGFIGAVALMGARALGIF